MSREGIASFLLSYGDSLESLEGIVGVYMEIQIPFFLNLKIKFTALSIE